MRWTKNTFCFVGDKERQSWIDGMKSYNINSSAETLFRELQKPFRVTDIDPIGKGVVGVEIDGVSYTAESIGVGIIFLLVDRELFKKVNVAKNTHHGVADDEMLLALLDTFHVYTTIRVCGVVVKNKKELLSVLKRARRNQLKNTELIVSNIIKDISNKQQQLSVHENRLKELKNNLPF